MERDSMIFYESFYDAIEKLPEEQQLACYRAIMQYALKGVEPAGTGVEAALFILMRPQIDANNRKYEAGKKGGRPKTALEPCENQPKPEENHQITNGKPSNNQDKTIKKSSDNHTETKAEPNDNGNANVNGNGTEKEVCTHARGERFSEFFAGYPKQEGQQMAAQEYISLLTSTPALEEPDLIQAAKNYAEACEGVQPRFIKKAGNWLSDGAWMDYIPGKYKKPAAKIPGNRFAAFPQRAYTPEDYQSMEQRLLRRGKRA